MYNQQHETKIKELEAELLKTKESLKSYIDELNKSKGRAYMVMICELDLKELEYQLDIANLQLAKMTAKYKKLRSDSLRLVNSK